MACGTRGFALIELVIVLGAGSLLAVAAVWQVRPLGDRLALRAATVRLVGDLRDAQARALAARDPARGYGIAFVSGGARYAVFVQTEGVRATVREQRLHPRVRITYARFGGTPDSIMFTGVSLLGAPSGGGTVTLSAGGALLCIRVQPATGRARIDTTGCP